jgi:hypothetical protein
MENSLSGMGDQGLGIRYYGTAFLAYFKNPVLTGICFSLSLQVFQRKRKKCIS